MASPPPLLTAATENKATPGRSWKESVKPSVLIMILILSVTVIVSVSLCLLLRHLKKRRLPQLSPSPPSASSIHRVNPEPSSPSTRSNKDSTVSGDCAVCLSKFEPSGKPKVLPLCGHAFHAHCIDTWLASNRTCPLCRSLLFPSESSDLAKVLHGAIGSDGSGSFRLEIGSISAGQSGFEGEQQRTRSYSVGSFDCIVEEESENTRNQTHRRDVSDKEEFGGSTEPEAALEGSLAADVDTGSGRSWVKDYVDRLSFSLSSHAVSFRSSGRFFTGSSRRRDTSAGADYDVEANRMGEEISEMFRWLSGV